MKTKLSSIPNRALPRLQTQSSLAAVGKFTMAPGRPGKGTPAHWGRAVLAAGLRCSRRLLPEWSALLLLAGAGLVCAAPGPAARPLAATVSPRPVAAVSARADAAYLNWNNRSVLVHEGHWLVRIENSPGPVAAQEARMQALLNQLPAKQSLGRSFIVKRHLGDDGLFLIAVNQGRTSEEVLADLRPLPGLKYVEPDFMAWTMETRPNDPKFSALWAMNNSGQTGGTPGADIDAPEAWDVATGCTNVIVAILDTGIDYTHPDLVANLWINPLEIPGNGIDDDGNGYIDDVYGYDFCNKDGDPWDDNGHGTHVAGTIAGAGNNARGVAGVNWSCRVMALKSHNADGWGAYSDAIAALYYVRRMKALHGFNVKLTSNSWGGEGYSESLRQAIADTGAEGILCIAAAGNNGTDNDLLPLYPAAYDCANLITVAASDPDDLLASFSCYGATSVDLAAPGVGILSSLPGNRYESWSGTSMATPHVAGVAALAWSLAPEATPDQIQRALLDGVDRRPAFAGKMLTGGRLNARGTLNELRLGVRASLPAPRQVLTTPPTQFTITFSHPYDPSTVQPQDLQVNGIRATGVNLEDTNTATFSFTPSPVTAEGPQTMAIAAGSLQRQDGLASNLLWRSTFYYDLVPQRVVSSTPATNQVVTSNPAAIVLEFSEPVDPASLGADALLLNQGQVACATLLTSNTVNYTLTNLVEGLVEYQLVPGGVTDGHGNPGPAFRGSFTLDHPLVQRFDTADPPRILLDTNTITSTISIPHSISIADLDVQLNLWHDRGQDLAVFLMAPNGTRVELFSKLRETYAFQNTLFDDQAEVPITGGQPALSGRYRPKDALAAFNGLNTEGTWTLQVTDITPGKTGILVRWGLLVRRAVDMSPRIISVRPLVSNGCGVWGVVSNLSVEFSDVMASHTVNQPGTWELREAGADLQFDTPDDATIPITIFPPYAGGLTANLIVATGPLPPGQYRLKARSGGIADPLGNPLDGNGDGTGGDDYLRSFFVKPVAAALPLVENFEAGTLPRLNGYWEFVRGAAGRIQLSRTNSPRNGTYHLQMDETALYAGPQYAILHLDLAGQTGVSLDFWQKAFGAIFDSSEDSVQISTDGRAWHEVLPLRGAQSQTNYQHFAVDLDAAAAAAGLALTNHLQIRFGQDNGPLASGGFVFDAIRVAAGLDLFGPRVKEFIPASLAAETPSWSNLVVAFSEAISPASLVPARVVLKNPQGVVVNNVIVAPVEGSGNVQFDLTFTNQNLRGHYRLSISSNVTDLAANPMNQNSNALNGEWTDAFNGSVWYPPTVTTNRAEGFEAWISDTPSAWSFLTSGAGSVTASASYSPHSGARHLLFSPNADSSAMDLSVTLTLDLSELAAATNLYLSFWAKYANAPGTLYLELSGDGTNYQSVWNTSLATAYTQYVLPLDTLVAASHMALDRTLSVRFRDHNPGSSSHRTCLDDVEIGLGDRFGPAMNGLSPAVLGAEAPSLSNAVVSFTEPLAPASFSTADVRLKDPQGIPLANVTVHPLAGSDNSQFLLGFTNLTVRGQYRLTIGPNLTDLEGNAMDQNSNGVSGEAADIGNGTIWYAPVTTTNRAEDFEAWTNGPSSAWGFITTGNGQVRADTAYGPHSGSRHLVFNSNMDSNSWQAATLAADLSAVAESTNLYLIFWARSAISTGAVFLELSGDATNYQTVWSSRLASAYTQYTLDLRALAAASGLALDQELSVRFRGNNFGIGSHRWCLDDMAFVTDERGGPWVNDLMPASVAAETTSLSHVRLTFSEAMAPDSFTPADVVWKDPQGLVVSNLTTTALPASGNTQFDLSFSPQAVRGQYRLSIGPNVTDLAGNPMNQNRNALNGEAGDLFTGTVWYAPAPTTNRTEDFEGWTSEPPSAWSFLSAGNGLVTAQTSDGPHAGLRHLVFNPNGDNAATNQYATLTVAFTESGLATNAYLKFWAKRVGAVSSLSVELGGEGTNFVSVWNKALTASYTQYALDLRALAANAGLALNPILNVRFHDASTSNAHRGCIDDVELMTGAEALTFASISCDNGHFRFAFLALPEVRYTVLSSTNLEQWELAQAFIGTGGQVSFSDTNTPPAPQRFYRVRIER